MVVAGSELQVHAFASPLGLAKFSVEFFLEFVVELNLEYLATSAFDLVGGLVIKAIDGVAEAKRRRSWVAPEASGLRGSGVGHFEMTFLFCSTTGDIPHPRKPLVYSDSISE